jgi:L-lactate dehydrogenase (cytochrome)
MIISSPEDFREAARRRVPPFLFHYMDGGAGAERTMARNRADLAEVALRQRVLANVADIRLDPVLFGKSQALPVALGPSGLGGMYARRGEMQAARAARDKGVPFCLSTVSLCGFEEVARGAGTPPWLQLYVIRDRAFMGDLLDLAREAGSEALLFTVDMPVPGIRYRDARAGMSGAHAPLRRMFQAMRHPRWAWDVGLWGRPHRLGNLAPVLGKASGMSDYIGWLGANFDPSIAWKDLDWIRTRWKGPLILKGILDPEDAREAAAIGADGVVVSNHGGRQLDGVRSSAHALPTVADAVGDRLTVLADGGVRTGLDVVRMLALGADGVLLGRAWLYALAARGEAGVARLLDMFAGEMRVAMALSGVTRIGQIGSAMIAP